MQIQHTLMRILIPLAVLSTVVLAYRHFGWPGVALAGGLLVMWVLLHFTRMMQVLKRAANRPIGHVDSAVMLNAKLRPGVPLMHIIALTRSLGELLTPKDTQPERFRWRDASESSVTCELLGGKLVSWTLERPSEDLPAPEPLPAADAPGGPSGT
jgi:hypothetical protein